MTVRFTINCPECGACVITDSPKALIWETCPGCRRYLWELDDVMMAEPVLLKPSYKKNAAALLQ